MEEFNHINDAEIMAYLAGELDNHRKGQVDAWRKAHPENESQFVALKEVWEYMEAPTHSAQPVDVDRAWAKVREQLTVDEPAKVIPMKPRILQKRVWRIAAVFVFIAGIAAFFTLLNRSPRMLDLYAKHTQHQRLEDGTEVRLTAGSHLSYPEEFAGNTRQVRLSGKAHFKVQRNPAQPFVIELPEALHIKVLGTAFDVDAVDGQEVTVVTVVEGKVEFGTEQETVTLVIGETGRFNHRTKQLEKWTNAQEVQLETYEKSKRLSFESARLSEVVEVLNHVFPEKVVLDCSRASNLPIVSDHQNESLESILAVIAAVHNLQLQKTTDGFVLRCND